MTIRLLGAATCVIACALLAACGTAPPHHASYYQEDGPPEHVPDGLMATPDAVPREEPFNPFANQPYRALGHTYTPDTSDRPFKQRGFASWYGRQFQGNRTADGERYDMFAMTAAHPTLPIPSYARVTNLKTGASVIVRVNDRGPFLYDRVIDLSYVAAVRLGVAARGTDEVEIERILPRDIARGAIPAPPALAALVPPPPVPAPSAVPLPAVAAPPVPAPAVTAVVAPAAAARVATRPEPPTPLPPPAFAAAPSPALLPPAPAPVAPPRGASNDAARWAVQVGAFSLVANAEALRDRIALLLSAPDAAADLALPLRAARIEIDGPVYRVLVGPMADRAAAAVLAQTLARVLARGTTLYFQP